MTTPYNNLHNVMLTMDLILISARLFKLITGNIVIGK